MHRSHLLHALDVALISLVDIRVACVFCGNEQCSNGHGRSVVTHRRNLCCHKKRYEPYSKGCPHLSLWVGRSQWAKTHHERGGLSVTYEPTASAISWRTSCLIVPCEAYILCLTQRE
jgi:hypothetical protein